MTVHRHELEDVLVVLQAAPEDSAAFVRRERYRCDRTARIVDRHGEATADFELRRLVKQCMLSFRQGPRRKFIPPFERLGGRQRLTDD